MSDQSPLERARDLAANAAVEGNIASDSALLFLLSWASFLDHVHATWEGRPPQPCPAEAKLEEIRRLLADYNTCHGAARAVLEVLDGR